MLPQTSLAAIDATMKRLEAAWLPEKPGAERFYAHESLSLRLFFKGLDMTGDHRRFLDVGCGSGIKLVLMHHLGWRKVAGIERHLPYVEVARRLCPEATVIHADAMDVTTTYGSYDVVYSYRLCVDDDEQAVLERHIVSHMRPGAYAFFPMGIARDLGDYLGDGVWLVI